ncbi:unnamed protein product [Natator depressus]
MWIPTTIVPSICPTLCLTLSPSPASMGSPPSPASPTGPSPTALLPEALDGPHQLCPSRSGLCPPAGASLSASETGASDQRHRPGSGGQCRVHHRPGPRAAEGAAVSEAGPAAGGDRDLTELGSAPWDPGGAAAVGPRGDLCWAAVPHLCPAPWAAPAPRHSHGGHHPAVPHPGPDLQGDAAVLPAATGWRQMIDWVSIDPICERPASGVCLDEPNQRSVFGRLSRDLAAAQRAPEESPLLRLVSLQNADISWNLDPRLAAVLGVSETDARGRIPSEDVTPSIWATVLAMVWLHGQAVGQCDESSCWRPRLWAGCGTEQPLAPTPEVAALTSPCMSHPVST